MSQTDQEEPEIKIESKHLLELQQQKSELLLKVQNLRQELGDWRTKLDAQVKTYRTEITDLRKTLNNEIEALRTDFQDLRAGLKQQLDIAAGLAMQELGANPTLEPTKLGAEVSTS